MSRSGALNPVEKLPPQIERAFDRAPDAHALTVAQVHVAQDMVADVAVIAIGDLVHVEERDLLAAEAVAPLKGARERPEVSWHLPFGGDIDRAHALGERTILGRELE